MKPKYFYSLILITLIMLLVAACAGSNKAPTYSQIVKTYPADAKLCGTVASIVEVLPSGAWKLSGTASGSMEGEWITYDDITDEKMSNKLTNIVTRCYGTKITANVSITIATQTYEPGTKLTVDKNKQWVVASSWD